MDTNVKPTLILDTEIQVALFNKILRKNIIEAGGRWAGPNPKGHADIFKDMEVRVKKDGEVAGCNVALLKNNYNFNDSGWTNLQETLEELTAIATEANGGKTMTKRDIVANLEHIKEILKKSPKAVAKKMADAVNTAETQVKAADTSAQEDNETIGEQASKKPAGKTNKAA